MFDKIKGKNKDYLDNEFLDQLEGVLENIQTNVKKALELVRTGQVDEELLKESIKSNSLGLEADNANSVVEGVFNGQIMIGSDGKEYVIPPNYASKSKLVEGDLMKLTITGNGSFVYKQIGPVDREQIIATLTKNDSTGEYYALTDDGKKWKLLNAAVTYFHGKAGDKIVVVVPKGGKSAWGAVENLIK
ncbi:hypothetical protein KKA15_00455 [Patescibacteria group bacterium]|nr:hypothetical protein [Patescibacteria group bacterium]